MPESPAADTIEQTITKIRAALRDYIEATYHISDAALVARRRVLLNQEGVLFRAPYIESTPRYRTSRRFADLDIPESAKTLFAAMTRGYGSRPPLIYDPPYTHQAEALETAASRGMSAVITTGTGSGKTESFLLPLLAKLAAEASGSPASFAMPAIRAILLYPMNALVNDQLSRLRTLFGDDRVTEQFTAWAGRPARFARYTSRTLYPGVRTAKKDQVRLKPIEHFYIALLQQAAGPDSPERDEARELIANLKARGKWPSKPDLLGWYGASRSRWQDPQSGEFIRAVLRQEDAELFTRHEVLDSPPDLLVTNYSMLEYMLMRPLERPVFDRTEAWLAANPGERLLLVIDEAHMYRGAAGAEVGLLLRRLRARLGIPADRLQVICAGASFTDTEYARDFAAQLAGKAPDDFRSVYGELALREGGAVGSTDDARALAAVPLAEFYEAPDDRGRSSAVQGFLSYRQTGRDEGPPEGALYEALHDFPPMSQLVNLTMRTAMPLSELGARVFPGQDAALADKAVTALLALGSAAHPSENEAGLLPCRVHAFFRGLPGLWACTDPACPAVSPDSSGGPTGALYSQPRNACTCGARVFEFYTCRNCGSAYARGYTDDLKEPSFLWNEPGEAFRSVTGEVTELHALDLLLEEPSDPATVELADLDMTTGRLNPRALGNRTRRVYLPPPRLRDEPAEAGDENEVEDDARSGKKRRQGPSGEFRPCGVCGTQANFGRSSVQDHQTKGDQPFQALITRQIEVQPPGVQPRTDFAPLRGRKVLTFSDSRQTAARLAPNLQNYSMRDVLRPLIMRGWRELSSVVPALSLEDLYLAVLIGAAQLSVRLRPELKGTESLHFMTEVETALQRDALHDPEELTELRMGGSQPPQSLLRNMIITVTDRHLGFQPLGLASIRERSGLKRRILALPAIPGVAETDPAKLALARLWLGHWIVPGIWFNSMQLDSYRTLRGVQPASGSFTSMDRWLSQAKNTFDRTWLPTLVRDFCEMRARNKYVLRAANVALDIVGEWAVCRVCRTTQRPFPGADRCINCRRNAVETIDPKSDAVFTARKGYYRASSVAAMSDPPARPVAIVAAEHTAQLNAAQADEVFSKAEEHELLFQDVDLSTGRPDERPATAIDVLSCTTTMEVGIDIGTLSGVALRNMPPSRASYQQRAGRAGRRGNSVATVVAFGSSDGHDEHYFADPDAMIRGPVKDPVLTLNNGEIARRHVTAYLLQRYLHLRLRDIKPEDQPQLFEVLGSVPDFARSTNKLNRGDLEEWLRENSNTLAAEVDDWLPTELPQQERAAVLRDLPSSTLKVIDGALAGGPDEGAPSGDGQDDSAAVADGAAEEGEELANPHRAKDNLLDRLLYKGVLPRYAFPTDVVSFYVFDREQSNRFRPEYRYAPSQGLPAALTQYAPGKEVWIDGKLWTSGALFSPMSGDLHDAWQGRLLYFECRLCHYARTQEHDQAEVGANRDCPACGTPGTFGPGRNWIRPPGFAHPQSQEERTSLEDLPPRSYATRAKLVAGGPDAAGWTPVTSRIREHFERRHLLVSNTGPRQQGYTYCTKCGMIEPTSVPTGIITGPHPKPYPDPRSPGCPGSRSTRRLVLGADFISDVLLISLTVEPPLTLKPGLLATNVALRTLSEATTIAATRQLEIEPSELQAEYRPALTDAGHLGLEAEIYLYDTLPGGAGFARRVKDLGQSIFDDAIDLLEGCPADCEQSCYRCLRRFGNRFEHSLLDRRLGASLLRYLVRMEEPVLDPARTDRATGQLYEDLARQGLDGTVLERNTRVDMPRFGPVTAPILARSATREMIIGIHGPLTPDYAADESLRSAMARGVTAYLADEIVISRNLPWASAAVIAELG
jgi:ATP-dependent helicase YprA (DUF1998 family)